jgi:hypothetical protein
VNEIDGPEGWVMNQGRRSCAMPLPAKADLVSALGEDREKEASAPKEGNASNVFGPPRRRLDPPSESRGRHVVVRLECSL